MVAHFTLRMYDVKKVFFRRKKIGFDDFFDVTKCLQPIEIPDLLHMCALCSKLPSNISTMPFTSFPSFFITFILFCTLFHVFTLFIYLKIHHYKGTSNLPSFNGPEILCSFKMYNGFFLFLHWT